MKSYNSIPTYDVTQHSWVTKGQHHIFDKIDGSNIRAEWSKKHGFYKFGSRHKLIDKNTPIFGEAIDLIQEKASKIDDAIYCYNSYNKTKHNRFVFFFEFWGDNSCFGSHVEEEHRVTLIDISIYKYGLINPSDFVNCFDTVGIPNYIYYEFFPNLILDDPMVGPEGIIVKGKYDKRFGGPPMIKYKKQSWYDGLREKCSSEQEFKERM